MVVRRLIEAVLVGLAILGLARIAWGQTSSLYVLGEEEARESFRPAGGQLASGLFADVTPANEVLTQSSFISVSLPEPRKFRLHDLITIIVREQKRYESDGETEEKKDVGLEGRLAEWFRIHDGKWLQQAFRGGVPEVDFEMKGKWKGEGTVEREDEFSTRITAEVIDVKPNGNLVLQARKSIDMDEERQVVTLTGVCRSLDVSPENTVLSTQVADLTINVEHAGAVRDGTRRGWVPRFFDLLRPF
jgi:flagellar basal body L-ring protein FlgH